MDEGLDAVDLLNGIAEASKLNEVDEVDRHFPAVAFDVVREEVVSVLRLPVVERLGIAVEIVDGEGGEEGVRRDEVEGGEVGGGGGVVLCGEGFGDC